MVRLLLLVAFLHLSTGQRSHNRYNSLVQDGRFRPTLQRPPPINDLPIFDPYNPEKAPEVPIRLGERSKEMR